MRAFPCAKKPFSSSSSRSKDPTFLLNCASKEWQSAHQRFRPRCRMESAAPTVGQ